MHQFGFVDYSRPVGEVAAVCQRLGLTVPFDLPVGALPLGQRQMVEIARALFRRPKVLIVASAVIVGNGQFSANIAVRFSET